MNRRYFGSVMLGLLFGIPAGQLAADESTPLQRSLKDIDVHGSWIYNNLGDGFAQSKKTGKPLLIVFR